MSTVLDGQQPAGTSPAAGSYADLFRKSQSAQPETTPAPERPGTEPAVTPPSATPAASGKVETAPASEPGNELEQEPEHSGTPEDKQKAQRGWSRLRNRAIRAEEQNRILREQLAEMKSAGAAPATPAETKPATTPQPGRPKLSDYTDKIGATYTSWEEAQEAHSEAVADWKYDQRESQREAKETERAQKDAQARTVQEQEKRLTGARRKYEDFDETALSKDLELNGTQVDYVRRRADGFDVLYYLGKNPQDAERILQLEDPDDVVAEMNAISRKLKTPPAVKKETSVPEPPRKVGGKTPAQTDPITAAAERGDWVEYNRLQHAKEVADWKKANGR